MAARCARAPGPAATPSSPNRPPRPRPRPPPNPWQNAEFDIKKEAAWAISNATSGGTAEQIRALVEVRGPAGAGCWHRRGAEGARVGRGRVSQTWLASGAPAPPAKPPNRPRTHHSPTHPHRRPNPPPAPQVGCIKPLCDLLGVSDVRIVTVALEGLENILKAGEAAAKAPGGGGQNPYAQLVEDAEGLDKIEALQARGGPLSGARVAPRARAPLRLSPGRAAALHNLTVPRPLLEHPETTPTP
jgi:hypothetical protein